MSFEIIKTEYTNGRIGNTDSGSKVRVVMRSPKAFLYSAYGLTYYRRGSRSANDVMKIAQDAKRATILRVATEIDRLFGMGAADALVESTSRRGYGTVLVDGGGDPLPLPHHEARKVAEEQFNSVSPDYDIRTEVSQRHCLQCGDALKLLTTYHRVEWHVDEDKAFRTLEQCQRLSNNPVVALHGARLNHPKYWANVEWFETWDGVSYQQDTFCSDKCAMIYGRRAAAELPNLPVGGEYVKAPYVQRDHVDHKGPEERTMIFDGKIYKV